MSDQVKAPSREQICESCGYGFSRNPEGVRCVSESHILGNKVMRRLYDFMPTRRVEIGGKVLYDVTSSDIFRVVFGFIIAPKPQLCNKCGYSIKADPRSYDCKSSEHLDNYLTHHRERVTRYLNNRQFRGEVPNKVIMSHKQVALGDPKLKQITINFGARPLWANPVRQILLFDRESRLVWGSAREWTFRPSRVSKNPDIKEIMIETSNITRLEVPQSLADLGLDDKVTLRLFNYVPPKAEKVGE